MLNDHISRHVAENVGMEKDMPANIRKKVITSKGLLSGD
jgi:hypothetical protein